ncbi:exported hypothetical protein [Cupriavidus taiwanensis]|nr:exported hypothetical protein [Cupriavidus taiwanensis]SPA32210.1 exported hypothetical protein [Cupriavidus taiwanensis]
MPSSRVSSAAMLSALASRCSAARLRMAARLPTGVFLQPAKAAAAAATAACASTADDAWKRPTMSAVSAGLTLSKVRPDWQAVHSPSIWFRNRVIVGADAWRRSGGHVQFGQRQLFLDVIVIERGRVQQPHLRADLADVQAALLQLRRIGVLQHDLVAALAVDLVRDDMQVEELDLFVSELVLVAQRRGLLAVDRRHLRLQSDHKAGHGHDRILAHGHRIAPALQAARGGRHVVRVDHALARGAAGFGKADQQVGVAVATDLFLVHVGEQEILGFGIAVRRTGVDVAQVIRERADVVIVVLGPAREMGAGQLAAGPGHAERRLVGALAFDGFFKGGTEIFAVHQFGHDGGSWLAMWGDSVGWMPGPGGREIGLGMFVYYIQSISDDKGCID